MGRFEPHDPKLGKSIEIALRSYHGIKNTTKDKRVKEKSDQTVDKN